MSDCDLSGCPCDADDEFSSEVELSNLSGEQNLVERNWGLRMRARIEELGVDLSQNTVVLHPSFRPPSFEEIASRTPRININELYVQSVFYFLRFLTMSGQALAFLWLFCGNVARGIKKTFNEDQYVFFHGSSYPYRLEEIQLHSPGVPEVEWYYNSKTRTFLTSRLYNNSQAYHTHHIPYLTAEVRYNDLDLYDVSEFFNSVRWAGEDSEAMPSVDLLLSAWSVSSGIILKRSSQMVVVAINTDGNEVRIPLRQQA